ncbi:HAD superfamily [Sesbania bispinosa]|nr:HAD superfamily [Sesbania bispinosa]
MSAYANQLEQSSFSDDSEAGTHYELVSGFYMTSFTATIFVASLVTLGVLLITLLITLVIMLESCQSRNTGVVELLNINDYYSYCRVYSLHAELNNLEGYGLPSICRDLALHYIKGGQYARDLNLTISMIDDYFKSVRPSDDGLDVVLMDIDDIVPLSPYSSNLFHRFHNDSISNCIKEAKNVKLMLLLRLYMNLQTGGWSMILLSREPGMYQNVTINHLVSAGFRDWSSLMMRAEGSDSPKGNEYFSRQRNVIQKKGFRIKSIISSHMDALTPPDTRIQNFLLPDLVCDKFEQQIESIDTGH